MVEIDATTAGSAAIPPVVLSGDADIGLAFSLPRSENLQQRAVGKFRIGAVVQADHPLTRGTSCDVCGLRALSPDPGSATAIHPCVDGAPAAASQSTPHDSGAGHVGRTHEIARLARLGRRPPAPLGLEAERRDGLLVHLPLNDPVPLVSELGAYVRAGRPLPSAVDAFLNVLSDELMAREAREP